MKLYKKKVKKHEEVWVQFSNLDDALYDDARVRVCTGNSNYGRLYVHTSDEYMQWLNEEDTRQAFELFKEIWTDNVDNHPFTE